MDIWFYSMGGEQVGPRSAREIQDLVAAGTITDETMMWTDGLEDWQPYETLSQRITSSLSHLAPAEMTTCPNCGAKVPSDDLARAGDTQVCPHCKEDYVQRIREGLTPQRGQYEYAGFWIRFGAQFIDGLILWVIHFGLMFVLGLGASVSSETSMVWVFVVPQLLSISVSTLYVVFFLGNPRFQATPGKMACRLRVICVETHRVTYLRALGRYFSTILSSLILCIGYLMCIGDAEKRCLHDRICNTRVVRR